MPCTGKIPAAASYLPWGSCWESGVMMETHICLFRKESACLADPALPLSPLPPENRVLGDVPRKGG